MTDSMIPYSFVPGTKAKAGEVNANFIALAEIIAQNQKNSDNNIEIINGILDKINSTLDDELFLQENVVENSTDLNDYKRKGVYFFSCDYAPANAPTSKAGTLVVLGDETSSFKQIWFSDEEAFCIFSRNYSNSNWTEWNNSFQRTLLSTPGYIIFPNGLMIQWGTYCSPNVTYPIAFTTSAPAVVAMKQGYSTTATRADQGFTEQSGTGFKYSSVSMSNIVINWIAIGY